MPASILITAAIFIPLIWVISFVWFARFIHKMATDTVTAAGIISLVVVAEFDDNARDDFAMIWVDDTASRRRALPYRFQASFFSIKLLLFSSVVYFFISATQAYRFPRLLSRLLFCSNGRRSRRFAADYFRHSPSCCLFGTHTFASSISRVHICWCLSSMQLFLFKTLISLSIFPCWEAFLYLFSF